MVRTLFLLILLMASHAQARQDDDLDALRLADNTTKPVVKTSDWHNFIEAAYGQARLGTGARSANQRLSIDLHYDSKIAPGWRAVLSDRIDTQRQSPLQNAGSQKPAQTTEINTLREAYLSWQRHDHQHLDFGRINAYQGVASGYNPSDFFRTGAVRSMISVDPASLKKNRLGSVMLRGQQLWDGGSFSALYSPKLATTSNPAPFALDLGATNSEHRYLFTLSQKISEGISPQWLIYGQERASPQLGLNLSVLPGDAVVAYLEYAGGRGRTQLNVLMRGKDDSAWRNRLSTGLSYTSSFKLNLTVEYEYNGRALDRADWSTLRQGSAQSYGSYRIWQQAAQELATKEELFLYASWQDAGLLHLDLAAMQKINLADHSRLTWLEARYHLDQIDLALQWQKNSGERTSVYGAAQQKTAWQAVLRYYF